MNFKYSKIFVGTLFCASLLVIIKPIFASDEDKIPSEQRAQKIVVALSYLDEWGHSDQPEFKIAVVYPMGCPAASHSSIVSDLTAKASGKIKDKPFKIISIGYKDMHDLKRSLEKERPSAIYIADSNDEPLMNILNLTRELRIISIGSKEIYIKRGATLGLTKENNTVKILVNLAGCNHEHAKFSARLLADAKILF